jgi:membrane protein implicated in regulation of membrane protease activity
MTIGVLYLVFLVLGVTYALIAGALGWFSDLGGGGDIHVDASGHLDAGHVHPLSGTVIATFVTGFGGGGVVAHYLLEWKLVGGLLLATVSGIALAAAAFGVLELIFSQTQAGSEFAMDEVAGRSAEVITAIPENGAGEVAYTVRGQREVSAARTVTGQAIPKGRLVVVERVTGNTLFVRARQ